MIRQGKVGHPEISIITVVCVAGLVGLYKVYTLIFVSLALNISECDINIQILLIMEYISILGKYQIAAASCYMQITWVINPAILAGLRGALVREKAVLGVSDIPQYPTLW